MAFSRLFHKLPPQLLLVASSILITYAVCRQAWIWGGIGLIMGIAYLMISIGKFKRLKEQCWIILEAVKNADYSFRLANHHLSYEEAVLQQTLNDFGQLMSHQKQLMEQRERFYEQILSGISLGIIVLNEDKEIIQSNPSAARLLGIFSVNSLQQLGNIQKDIPEMLSQLEPGEKCNIQVQTPTGVSQLLVRASTMTLGQKKIKILTLNDIKNELDSKELDSWVRLTRVLTHEIMNSIAPISSLSQTFLQKEDIIRSPYYEGIRAIHETSVGLISFVDSYRKFSSLQKPTPEPFYLNELMSQINELQLIPENIRLSMQIEPTDLMLYADPNLIRQVIINLLKNAVQAIGDAEGKIHIHALTTRDEHILVYVSNDGPEIPEEVAEQIFVPFFTTKREGSGIGLSVSRQIMKLSGGSISLLRHREHGWNTTFVLEFE